MGEVFRGCWQCSTITIKTHEPQGNVVAILIADKAIPTGDLTCEINWAETLPKGGIKLQHEDAYLSVVFQWLEGPPTPHYFLLSSPASRSYWMCKNQLIVRDWLIFYAWLNGSQRRLCLFVHKTMQQEVLHCCHDMKSSAHLGHDNTCCELSCITCGTECPKTVGSMFNHVPCATRIRSRLSSPRPRSSVTMRDLQWSMCT